MTVGQVAGEVVGTEHGDHAVRLVAQHGGGVGQRAALLAGALVVALHGDGDLVDHAGHLGGGLPQRFAGFLADGAGQLVSVRLEGGSELLQHGNALFQRTLCPGREGRTGGGDGLLDLRGSRALAAPHGFLGYRIERIEGLALPGQPLAGDVMSGHCLLSLADSGTARTWLPALSCRRLAVSGSTTRVPAAARAGAAVMRQSSRLRL